jgi:hypothetical protein
MDPKKLFIDQRLVGMCIHCGGDPATRDHIPAKALLDEPYPPDLPVMASCGPCNGGASLDEQYLACFIEVALRGTVNPEEIRRPKIRRILAEQPALKERIASSMSVALDGTKMWCPETERVRSVIVKLARGHAAYELYPKFDKPDHVSFRPLQSLTPTEVDAFEGEITAGSCLGLKLEAGHFHAHVVLNQTLLLNQVTGLSYSLSVTATRFRRPEGSTCEWF